MIPQSYVMVVQALLGGDCKLTTIQEEEGNIMLDPTPLSNPTAAAAKSTLGWVRVACTPVWKAIWTFRLFSLVCLVCVCTKLLQSL